MTGRVLTVIRRARRGPGGFVCARCRTLVANDSGVEVARPGKTRGVWWCGGCAATIEGA